MGRRGKPRRKDKRQKSKQMKQPRKNTNLKDFYKFQDQLEYNNLAMQEVQADGNCLFRAIADQLAGDQNNHDVYRQSIVEYIIKCKDDFAPFIEDDVDFETYVEQMKEDGEWGGQIELTGK